MEEPILELKNVSVTYKNAEKEVYAVRNVNLTIEKGDSLGIVGESGSGKSTLIMALLRLLPENSTVIEGQARFLGRDLFTMTLEELNEIRWTQMAVVFQKAMNSMSPVHRIGTQFEDIYRVHEPKASRAEIKKRVYELFRLVNLPERVYKLYPHEMSGGMLQRVAIALSMLHHPNLLIFDEATTALDVVTQGQILKEVAELEKTMAMTRIMITHDMSVVAVSCSKIAVMYAGEFMEIGRTRDVLKNPQHPYTKGLLKAFPSLKGEIDGLSAIPGFLPDLSKQCRGCIFAPRCPQKTKACETTRPKPVRLADGRTVVCLAVGGEENE